MKVLDELYIYSLTAVDPRARPDGLLTAKGALILLTTMTSVILVGILTIITSLIFRKEDPGVLFFIFIFGISIFSSYIFLANKFISSKRYLVLNKKLNPSYKKTEFLLMYFASIVAGFTIVYLAGKIR